MIELGRDLKRPYCPNPAHSESPRTSSPGSCPGGFWKPSRRETSHLLRATCVSAQSPSQQESFLSRKGIFCVWVFVHCLFSCHWNNLAPSSLYRYLCRWIKSLSAFSSPGWASSLSGALQFHLPHQPVQSAHMPYHPHPSWDVEGWGSPEGLIYGEGIWLRLSRWTGRFDRHPVDNRYPGLHLKNLHCHKNRFFNV